MRGLLRAWSGQAHPWGLLGRCVTDGPCALSKIQAQGGPAPAPRPPSHPAASSAWWHVEVGIWDRDYSTVPPKTHTHTHSHVPQPFPTSRLWLPCTGSVWQVRRRPAVPQPRADSVLGGVSAARSRRPRGRSPDALWWPPRAEAGSLASPGSQPSGGGKGPETPPCGGDKISRLQAFFFPTKRKHIDGEAGLL